MIKNAFLQQNAFDQIDKYCSPEKQIKLLKAILALHDKGTELLKAGATVKEIAALDAVSEMVRLKSEIPNRELDRIDEYEKKLSQALDALKARKAAGEST
jgi:V/A-type H+-transporting ATPase subunit A